MPRKPKLSEAANRNEDGSCVKRHRVNRSIISELSDHHLHPYPLTRCMNE